MNYLTGDLDNIDVNNIFNEQDFKKNMDSDKRISLSFVRQEYGTGQKGTNKIGLDRKALLSKERIKPPKLKKFNSTDIMKVVLQTFHMLPNSVRHWTTNRERDNKISPLCS